jgi:hypothetical protein
MNTEQFMREMGVLSSDHLKNQQMDSLQSRNAPNYMQTQQKEYQNQQNNDLETVATPNLQFENQYGNNQNSDKHIISPLLSRPVPEGYGMHKVGGYGDLADVGQFLAPSYRDAHKMISPIITSSSAEKGGYLEAPLAGPISAAPMSMDYFQSQRHTEPNPKLPMDRFYTE